MDADKKAKQESEPKSDSKVIAEIHIRPAISYREQFLYDHCNCCLCGSELVHTNVTHFANLTVETESFCHSCNIRTKKETHSLQ